MISRGAKFPGDAFRGRNSDVNHPGARIRSACLLLAAVVSGPAVTERAFAQGQPTDRLALDAIFGDEHVRYRALDIHQRARKLAPTARYDFLAAWILPGPGHETLRIPVGFTPTDPASADRPERPANHAAANINRVQTGGDLVSPVWDLIEVARKLNRLEELRERISNCRTDGRPDDEFRRAAVLTLIEIAGDRVEVAARHLEHMLQIAQDRTTVDTPPTSAEQLVFQHAWQRPLLREALANSLDRCMNWARSDYMRAPEKAHVSAVAAKIRAAHAEEATIPVSVRPMLQWFPVSRATAETRGRGFPSAAWNFRRGLVENVASHDDDYLYFAIPLRGNYEVECDVHGFGWRDTHLMVAGTWVAPLYLLNTYEIGDFLQPRTRPQIVPPLAKTDPWIHYRTVVRDGVATTFFNGRRIHEEKLSADHDPWLAVRSLRQHNGGVRNLRITGEPVIPAELQLPVDRNLDSWLPYFESVKGRLQDRTWQSVSGANGVRELAGLRAARAADSSASQVMSDQERLLRYHRPMLEDGTIDYQFFYLPGEVHVHPALDRLAFLLHPEGVRIHWITDGPHERSTLAPDNVFEEPDHLRGPDLLPLMINDWNHLQLSLTDDIVELWLNDELICQRPLEPTNQRTFGLFHYADRSLARVRNIAWRGDWPRILPAVSEQELADHSTDFLDESLAHLTATFRHDFSKDGFPDGRFGVTRGNPKHVTAVAHGVMVSCPGMVGGYFDTSIATRLAVRGDFDIVASFDRFAADPPAGGSGSICLKTIFDNDQRNECILLRRDLRHKSDPQPIVQPEYVARRVEVVRRIRFGKEPVVEADSGRLRLARRGDTVYYLFAEGDSPHFRLFGTQRVPESDICMGGVQLGTIAQEPGLASVVWKDLTIRAEAVTGIAVEDPERLIAELNKQRAQLPAAFVYDFTQARAFDEYFVRKGDIPLPGDKGLPMIAPGTDNWTSVGVFARNGLTGDFDVEVDLEVLQMDQPAAGLRSDVFLQLCFTDPEESQVYVLFTREADGSLRVRDTVRQKSGDGAVHYRTLNAVSTNTVSGLRIARRGARLFFLFATDASDKQTLVSYEDVTAADVPPGYVWLMAHTGGTGRQTKAMWQRLEVRAAEFLDAGR